MIYYYLIIVILFVYLNIKVVCNFYCMYNLIKILINYFEKKLLELISIMSYLIQNKIYLFVSKENKIFL